jgi:hypothetical protein
MVLGGVWKVIVSGRARAEEHEQRTSVAHKPAGEPEKPEEKREQTNTGNCNSARPSDWRRQRLTREHQTHTFATRFAFLEAVKVSEQLLGFTFLRLRGGDWFPGRVNVRLTLGVRDRLASTALHQNETVIVGFADLCLASLPIPLLLLVKLLHV